MLCVFIFYDKSNFFLELLYEVYQMENLNLDAFIKLLLKESNELKAIIVASIKTSKNKTIKKLRNSHFVNRTFK
jgi:hypothetical protein